MTCRYCRRETGHYSNHASDTNCLRAIANWVLRGQITVKVTNDTPYPMDVTVQFDTAICDHGVPLVNSCTECGFDV